MPRYPYVTQGVCYPAAGAEPIAIGTPVWSAWIKEHTSFTYRDAPLSFTARREERPGGTYWYAYKRAHGKLRKRYLGRGDDISLQRLQEVAQSLLEQREDIAAQPEAPSLIATRFAIPRSAAEWVPRPQLLQRFSRAIERPCTIITAPAGSGKTTLLAMACEQLREQGWRIAWLSLERSERDPARFWRYALTAIERAAPGAASSALRGMQAPDLPASEAILAPLINTLAEQSTPLLLVLDDFHLAATAEIDAGLLFLIRHMPRALRLVIISRVEPALPLARLRVQRRIAELRQDDLRFSEPEAGIFLERTMGLHLAPEQIAALEARTEGWIAGLQLAALSLQRQTDVATFIAHFAGSNRYIGEYLMGEVIAGQPPDVQDFLLRTAMLPRMCGSLCDAVLGRQKVKGKRQKDRPDGVELLPSSFYLLPSQEILEQLERANLFLVALDDERRWYRYHHLFAEMLRERLAQQNPSLLAECHERAARWFAEHGDTRDAIQHALAAPAYPMAASLIETEFEPVLKRGEVATVLAWFRALAPATLDDYPRLSLFAVLTLLMNGEVVSATTAFQHLESVLFARTIDTTLQGELAAVRALVVLMTGGDITLAMDLAREALQRLPPEHGVVRDMASLLHGATTVLIQDDLAAAIQTLTQIALASMRHGNYLVASFALQNRAIKEVSQGRLHQAERTCHEALHMATSSHGRESPFASWAYMQLGDIYREWNQIERARATLEHGLAQGFIPRHPEIMVDGYIALARVYDLLGDRARAHDAMQAIERSIQIDPVTPHTAWQVEAFRARLLCAWGNMPEAARWAERYAESTRQTPQQIPPPLSEFSDFTLARIQSAQGRHGDAQRLLERLLESAQSAGRGRAVIEASLLLALTEQALGRTDSSMTRLADALQLAAPEGFVRLFLDEGPPLLDLLARYLTTRAIAHERHAGTAPYARLLLEQAGQAATPATPIALPDAPSAREMEILRLLAAGKSNDAIAQELFLALSTVKWHISHLYRKLGVGTRVQAVARARALKLLGE